MNTIANPVNSFAASIVEMAKATEALPLVQEALIQQQNANSVLSETIMQHELRIIELKREAETLHAKLRSVEAERDDASFRELEAEDKIAALTASLRTVFSSVGETLKAAQPEPKPTGIAPAVDDLPSPGTAPGGHREDEPGVSVTTDPIDATIPPVDAPNTSVSQSAASDSTEPPSIHGPYHGMNYCDYPAFVPLELWLAGGGTQATYDYRPPVGFWASAG